MRQIPRVFLLLSLLLPVQLKATPIYLNPSNGYPSGEHPNQWLEKRTSEIRMQKWLRLKLDSKTFAWTSEDTVLTRTNLLGRAYITDDSNLYLEPQFKSEALKNLSSGEFVTALGGSGEFLKIRTEDGDTGYMPKASSITAYMIGENEALVIRAGTVLRSAPTPDSPEIRRVQKLARFKIVDTETLKWGRVDIPEKGSVWYPVGDEIKVGEKTDWQKFTSSEVFLKRKIYDLAASPTVPNLRFASANGIFRTLDDKTWEKIPRFGEQNYPIAISKSGRLFIGFWYSDDHGETFHSYVRFDQLVSSLKNRWKLNPHRFKFLEVRPINETGTELVVRVDIGLKKPVEALTQNQGINWKAL